MYENETYEGILERILQRMPDSMDKRESSFLYNATAPIAVELQNMYIAIDNILDITFFDTSDREGKLQKCKERGIDITQFDATQSICVIAATPNSIEIPIGSRFNYGEINYIVLKKIEDGKYYAMCESYGTVGNITGDVTPVEYIAGLETAKIQSIYQYGEDEEDEKEIEEVYYASLNSQAFGGNRSDYIEKMKKITGVGGVKVYSAAQWRGGGTVKLVFTTSSFTKPTDSFVNTVQTQIDPIQNQGAGYGIAPIGHTVTVVGVGEVTVNISMSVVLQDGYTWEDVLPYINDTIDKYFESLNSEWDESDNIIVRVSHVESRVLELAGVIDISGIKINGNANNLVVEKDSVVVRGSVTNAD